MAKELLKGEIGDLGIGYEIKIEDGKIKVAATADLERLVDKAGEAIPGDNPIELLVLGMIKQSLKAL